MLKKLIGGILGGLVMFGGIAEASLVPHAVRIFSYWGGDYYQSDGCRMAIGVVRD